MPLRLRPATEEDSFRIGCIGRDAFRDNLSRSFFPPHLHHKSETGDPGMDEAQWRARRNRRRMKEGNAVFVVVDVAEDGSGPETVVGYAQWEPPSQLARASAAPVADEDPIPGSLDVEKLRAIFRTIDLETERALGPGGHSRMWYLMSLAVDPAQQRRGIGKMLVQHGLGLASVAGSDAFLIATPEGRGLYYSLGFREAGVCDLDGLPHYSMIWRNPGTGST